MKCDCKGELIDLQAKVQRLSDELWTLQGQRHMEDNNILFCPHCGSKKAPRISDEYGGAGYFNVICDVNRGGCGGCGGIDYGREDAIKKWNMRRQKL